MLNNISGFHIEPTNMCTLKCPGCARTRFINQWPQHWKNHSLDIVDLIKFLDIDLSGKNFVLSGTYGDPIYHPDFINFVKIIKQQQSSVIIVTNGSYKTESWWKELTELLDSNDSITFSIDGNPDNFTQYRINADWASIETAIKICTKSLCQTTWKYIPFLFNQADIESTRLLSSSLGFDHFIIDHSDRFDEQTIHYKPNDKFVGDRFLKQQNWKNNNLNSVIPKCQDNKKHFITADGFYSPCCFLVDYRFYYKSIFGKNKKMFDIRNTTLSEILSNPTVIDFYQNLNSHSGCQYNCPG